MASCFTDAWKAKHPTDPGFTCCQATDLLNPTSTLAERDDLVLTRGPFHVAKASIVGDQVADRLPSGLWPATECSGETDIDAPWQTAWIAVKG